MNQIPSRMASRARAALIGGAVIVAISSLTLTRLVKASDEPRVTPVALTVSETPVTRGSGFTTSFAPVVKQVAQSVVEVQVSTKSKMVPVPESQQGGDE